MKKRVLSLVLSLFMATNMSAGMLDLSENQILFGSLGICNAAALTGSIYLAHKRKLKEEKGDKVAAGRLEKGLNTVPAFTLAFATIFLNAIFTKDKSDNHQQHKAAGLFAAHTLLSSGLSHALDRVKVSKESPKKAALLDTGKNILDQFATLTAIGTATTGTFYLGETYGSGEDL